MLFRSQARQTILKEKENDKITQDVAAAYSVYVDRLQNALRNRPMPHTADNASRLANPNWERIGACEGAFYSNALTCELKLQGVRDWVQKMKVPVE